MMLNRFLAYYHEFYRDKINKKKMNRIEHLKFRYNRIKNGDYISNHYINKIILIYNMIVVI